MEERVFKLMRLACLTSMLANKPTYANDNLVDRMCHQRLAGTYPCISPQSSGSGFANSAFGATLQTTTAKNVNLLYTHICIHASIYVYICKFYIFTEVIKREKQFMF